MSSHPVIRLKPAYGPRCECGCKNVIAQQKDLMRQLEGWATRSEDNYQRLKEKYPALEGSKEAADTLVRDIMEENTRLQRENKDNHRRLKHMEGATQVQPNHGVLQSYPLSEFLPDEARSGDQGLARRLLEHLAEVKEIAEELAQREEAV